MNKPRYCFNTMIDAETEARVRKLMDTGFNRPAIVRHGVLMLEKLQLEQNQSKEVAKSN